MKRLFIALFSFLVFTGCSKEDNPEEKFVGNKYANLLFNTREECEASWEKYFMNCAQTLEIISDSEVEIMVTDILYTTGFYVKNGQLIVESSPETYEFSRDLIFQISSNGDLILGDTPWMIYQESFYELYDRPQ